MRTRSLLLAGVLLLALAAPAVGQMSIAKKVLADFAADGVIDPCKHSSEELRLVLNNIPPDFEQYAPDYPAAVEGALEARARGECAGKKPQKAPVAPVATATPAPTAEPTPIPTAVPTKTVVPEPPEPEKIEIAATATATATPSSKPDRALERVATAQAANQAPAPVLLLAILAGLLALSALFLLAMRRLGLDAGPVGHAWREASYRSSGLWEDFRDWLRVGR